MVHATQEEEEEGCCTCKFAAFSTIGSRAIVTLGSSYTVPTALGIRQEVEQIRANFFIQRF